MAKVKRKILTLCFIQRNGEILLGMKKRGFGMGRWNGFGGKVEEGETIEEAAKREVLEEISISVFEVEQFAEIEFTFEDKKEILEVHVFDAKKWTGKPEESDEMRPEWFSLDNIPYKKMWPDDAIWFPLYLAGKKFRGKFYLNEKEEVLTHEISEIFGSF